MVVNDTIEKYIESNTDGSIDFPFDTRGILTQMHANKSAIMSVAAMNKITALYTWSCWNSSRLFDR